ncbi:MAG: selenium metabolism-associated LysR family transcriptional regulator [Chloroflexota bacterium]|nr:selenium metabolism-associated LysR family transcriptional regulator [Chloroflexota bacterium]
MNLDYLKTYLELVESGSFSEAAKRLSLSQPAVSFQIQKLERDLGVRLLDRSRKGIILTEAGKRLLRFAKAVAAERASLVQDLDRMREEVTGHIRLAASTIPGEVLLPTVLAEFKALHASITVSVKISDSLMVLASVKEGTFEIGFCGILPSDTGLEHFNVGEDEIVLIVFPEHPFAGVAGVSPLELEGEPLIVREETSGTQGTVNAALSRAGVDVSRWSPHLVLGSHQAVVSAVEAKAGIAFVSNLAIKKSLALGLVKQVPVQGIGLKRDFFCVYRKERLVSRVLQEFLAFVQARTTQA